MEFYLTERFPEIEEDEPHRETWDRLRAAYGPSDSGVCYYNFPVVDKTGGRFDDVPNFLLLHQDIGLAVVDAYGFDIDQISSVKGPAWDVSQINDISFTPIMEVKEKMYELETWFKREKDLRENGRIVIPTSAAIVLPFITESDWESKFGEPPESVILQDQLSPESFRTAIDRNANVSESVSEENIWKAEAVLSGSHVLTDSREPELVSPEEKGELYENLLRGLKKFDEKQESIGAQIPPGPQRIRGIAGSGKTVLIAKKAAHLHAKNPDADIAVTFYTRSLYQTFTNLIEHFHYMMADSEPNWDKIQILHGWGGASTRIGLYYKIAAEAGVKPKNVAQAKKISTGSSGPLELLDDCCRELVGNEDVDIPKIFDAIFIDEGQDFGKYFYQMAYSSIRENESGFKRLVWAYDEAQSLSTLDIPKSTEIFGTKEESDEPLVDLSGSYPSGIQKSRIMRRSYRSPREILMTAHVFGMGLKRDDGAAQAITKASEWEKIGYEVEGNFREGSQVSLSRPEEYSPHPLQDSTVAKPAVTLSTSTDKDEEVEYVADQVRTDINERELSPKDILIIPLGDPNRAEEYGDKIINALNDNSIEVNCMYSDGSDDQFRKEGKVTVSRINRAKGNEAAQVYLTSLEEVSNDSRFIGFITRRNQALVGISRARAWCSISGVDDGQDVFEELRTVIDEVSSEEGVVTFPASNAQRVEREIDTGDNFSLDDFRRGGLSHD